MVFCLTASRAQEELAKLPLDSTSDESFEDVREVIFDEYTPSIAARAFSIGLRRLPALARNWFNEDLDRSASIEVEKFAKKKISPRIVSAELELLRNTEFETASEGDIDAELSVKVSLTTREVTAKYFFSDVRLCRNQRFFSLSMFFLSRIQQEPILVSVPAVSDSVLIVRTLLLRPFFSFVLYRMHALVLSTGDPSNCSESARLLPAPWDRSQWQRKDRRSKMEGDSTS